MTGRTRSIVAAVAASGMLAGVLVWQVLGGSATADPVAKTLYFHANRPVSNIDQLEQQTLFTGNGPTMDENTPTGAAPKITVLTGVIGNTGFRKNQFNSYWQAPTSGSVVGPSVVRVWASSPGATIRAQVFGDGGTGQEAPLAFADGTVSSALPTEVVINIPAFPIGQEGVENEIVVQLSARIVAPDPNTTPTVVFFDSPSTPSRYEFNLGPLPAPGPKKVIADPTGIAIRPSGGPAVGTSATGELLALNADATVNSALVFGLVPNHFARGIQGVAVDLAGDVFYALPEEGEVRFTGPSGTGTYARGLGAPGGIAFASDGSLYVADQAAKRVLKVDSSGSVTSFGPTLPASPYGITISPDADRVFVSSPLAPKLGSEPPTTPPGKVYEVTSSVVTQVTNIDSAEGLAFDAVGNLLYVGSGKAGKIVEVNLTSGVKTDVATGKFGPLNLAATSTDLWLSEQGEGTGGTDKVEKIALPGGVSGFEAYRPALTPTALGSLPSDAIVHKAGAVALDPSTYASALPSATMRSTNIGASEPTIGVTADGTVYYMASDLDTSLIKPARAVVVGAPRPLIYKSTTNGTSWTDVTERIAGNDLTQTTADPYLYVDPVTGRVFNVELYGGCSYIAWTDNGGTSWDRNPLGCGLPVNDHQTLAAGPPPVGGPTPTGYPNIVYYCVNQVAVTSCARSLNGGATFTPAGNAFLGIDIGEPSGPQCGGLSGHVIVAADGYVYVGKGHCGRPAVAVSADAGLTWTKSVISTTVRANQHEISVGTDPSGNVYALFIGTDRLPYLAVSNNHGTSWSAPMMVAPPGVTEVNLPSLAVGDDGKVVMIYQGTSATCCYPTATANGRAYAKAAWNGYMTITTNALDALSSGEPVFATDTVNDRHDPLLRGVCGPDRCQAPYNWDFLAVVVAPDGRPWAAFIDSCVALCSQRETSNNNYIGIATPLIAGPKLRGSGNLLPV